MTTETLRKTGTSFNLKSNSPNLNKPTGRLNFKLGSHLVTSSAHAMTLIGYGDLKDLQQRNLQFRVQCDDFIDLKNCIETIGQYNDFEAKRVLKKAFWRLNIGQFWNENNANNGNNLFKFEIGREYSPVIYVHYNELFGDKIIKDTDDQAATETEEAKTIIYWEQYTGEDFKENMKLLSEEIGANEFSITEHPLKDKKYYTARFWFD